MMIKRITILVFALYANSIYTDEYIFFDSTQDLYNEVAKRSVKIGACLKKHKLMPLDPASPLCMEATHELIRVSEQELENYPILKKQFLGMIWLERSMGCFDKKEYAQSEYFCDLAIATDPENSLGYEIKSHFCREAGNEAQALEYERIANEKGIHLF